MITPFRVGVLAVLLVALGACSGLVPDIAADDLFGINGVPVQLSAADGGGVSASALPPSTSFEGSFEGSFVSDGFDVPSIVNASGLSEDVVIEATVTVEVLGEDATELLGDFTLVSGSIALQVYQDGSQLGTAAGAATFSPGILVSRTSCSYDAGSNATSCLYTAAVDPSQHAITVAASAASANAVFDAMRDGGVFDVQGQFAVTLAAPGLTASAVVTVVLNTSDGKITF